MLLTPPYVYKNRAEDTSPLESPTSISSFKQSCGSYDTENWNSSSPTAVSPNTALLQERPYIGHPEASGLNTQTVSAKYNISPSQGLLLYPEDVEKDDWLHNPDGKDNENQCGLCSSRGILNCLGLGLVVMGLMALFVGYPIA